MAGIPILNPALRVEVVGLQCFGDVWLCVLLTPWFMNVMLLPAGAAGDQSGPPAVGAKEAMAFPAGRFEMIHGFEPGLGRYRMCSLFSPVLEFADQESAVAAAEAALTALLEKAGDEDTARDPGMDMIWRGERPSRGPTNAETAEAEPDCPELSRRGLLFGRAHREAQR